MRQLGHVWPSAQRGFKLSFRSTRLATLEYTALSPKLKHSHIPIPDQMKSLPQTEGGYLKPWFVKGDDFRVTDSDKAGMAVMKQACWICGTPFETPKYAMVGDAMSAAIRVYREPPCHVECAEYAMQVCPFILYPNAKRREAGLDEEFTVDHVNKGAALALKADNPGEYFITVVSDFSYHHDEQVTAFNKSDVIERQHWIGGIRQETLPDPIFPPEQIPAALRVRI